jgi:hypothetical protein
MKDIKATVLKAYPTDAQLNKIAIVAGGYRFAHNHLATELNGYLRDIVDNKELAKGYLEQNIDITLSKLAKDIDTSKIGRDILKGLLWYLEFQFKLKVKTFLKTGIMKFIRYKSELDDNVNMFLKFNIDISHKPNTKNLHITLPKIGKVKCRGRKDINYEDINISFITLKVDKESLVTTLSLNFENKNK